MPIPIVFSKKYTVRVPGHVFQAGKFEAALELLLKEKVIKPSDVVAPRRPSRADLLLAHTPAWADKVLSGRLAPGDRAKAELEAGKEVVEAHLMNVGGTVLAARLALKAGLGVNCGGGAHHAFAGHGEGFCLLNDIAVAINRLRRERRIKRALVADLDAHQGNGTASIFGGDRDVFTFSMHRRDIYPAVKEKSSMDLEVPRGTGDGAYLRLLKKTLPAAFKRARPDLVVYNAGVDVHENDLLGGLKLTSAGIKKRDRYVFSECFKRRVPVVLVLSGGYAAKMSDTARLHADTIKAGMGIWGKYENTCR